MVLEEKEKNYGCYKAKGGLHNFEARRPITGVYPAAG